MNKKLKIFISIVSLSILFLCPININAMEVEHLIDVDYELNEVDATTSATEYIKYSQYLNNPVDKIWKTQYKNGIPYSGYLYYTKIIVKGGIKYAVYKGTLYGYVAPPMRKIVEE